MKIPQWMMWVERVPRPERNGLKGAVMMLSLMWFILMPMSGDGDSPVAAIVCEIMPWKCLNRASGSGDERYVHEWRFLTNIHFGRPSKNAISRCSCHIDLEHGTAITHKVYDQSATCESVGWGSVDEGKDLEAWTPLCETWYGAGLKCQFVGYMNGKQEFAETESGDRYRYHCTSDPKYSMPGTY